LEVQGLLEPATLEVNPKEEEALKMSYDSLAQFGFTLEPFGDRTYLVRTVPTLLHEKDWKGALQELLDSTWTGEGESATERIAISIACHSAVRAGQVLTDDEMRELLRQLEKATLPNTCPHGRPTMLHLNTTYLEREFGRRG
jgi:DNA mismatch repair protein MutL